MTTYIAKRLLAAIPVILGLSIIVFLVMKLIPGDPAQALLGSYATPDNVERINRALGLDRSWPEQYLIWIGNLVKATSAALTSSIVRSSTKWLSALAPP